MENDPIKPDFSKIVQHWITTSDEDFEVMMRLFDVKSYQWCLFLGQISLEKLLKALFVQIHRKHAPHSHNLYRLAEQVGISLSDEYVDWLDNITTFNLNARYDDYKRAFLTLCTLEYS